MNNILKKIKIPKIELILKIIFCVSLPFVTFLLSERANKIEVIISVILSFILSFFLAFKIFKHSFKNYNNNNILIISVIISIYIEKTLILYSGTVRSYINTLIYELLNINFSNENIIFCLVIFSLPSIIQLIYIFIEKMVPKIINLFKTFNKLDKIILFILLIIGFGSTFIIYNKTNAFYNPQCHVGNIKYYRIYDVIYTSDSSYIFNENAYLNINMSENDIRQPFFGLFAMPFALIAYILSDLLFFIPNGYAVFLNTIQILVLGLTILMITKILKLYDKNKLIYLLFNFCTFPLIIFSFIMEQYIFALFYLILAIYAYYFQLSKINYLYIGSVGTLITSGIIFPLISKFKSFSNWMKNVFKCFIAFCITVVLSGQLHLFINGKDGIHRLLGFSGKSLPLIDKLKQFLYFVQSLFIAATGKIILDKQNPPVYHLANINYISIIGIIILILCFVSIILNRKNKLAIISFVWIIFSFILLCLVGWGTQENGLILYSLYFSWAYIVLIYLLINKIIKNDKYRILLMSFLCIIMLIFNIPEFIKIIKFGIMYYGA